VKKRRTGRSGMTRLPVVYFACAILLSAPAPRATAGLLFLGDFEAEGIISLDRNDSPRSAYWASSGNPPVVTKAVNGVTPRAGQYMMKSYVNRLESPVSYRTEVVTRGDYTISIGKEYWYGFSVFLPQDHVPDNIWELVAQWHGRPDFDLGEDWRNPCMALRPQSDGNWHVSLIWDSKANTFESGERVYDGSRNWTVGPYARGEWTDWVFHVKWSYEDDGLLEIWQNDILIITRNGPNCFNDAKGPYFKMGIYKGWKDRYDPVGIVAERTLYHDEVRIGDANTTYADVAPSHMPLASLPLNVRVSAGTDDAEERLDNGSVSLNSSDLELGRDAAAQLVGMRFTQCALPQGVVIDKAWLEVATDEAGSEATDLVIRGQAADNASTFGATAGNLSSRAQTSASATWSVPSWTSIGKRRQSPDIAAVIQQIVNRPGWQSGNALVLLVSGTGKRVAESYEGDAGKAPLLHIEYRNPNAQVQPALAVGTTDISVSALEGQDAASKSFEVWNAGTGTLRYKLVETTSKLSVAPTTGTSTWSGDKNTHTITFTTADLAPGTYDRTIRVEDDGSGAANGPLTVNVHITIEQAPPAAPSAFAAEVLSATSVQLTWNDLPDETEYMLRRSLDGAYWYGFDPVYPAADVTGHTVTGLAPNTVYYFKLRGINAGGLGPYCEPVHIVTPRSSAGTFTAYNDLCWDSTQPAANITVLTRAEAGLLIDHGTGELLPVRLTLNNGGGTTTSYGADAAAGTDAAQIFGGIVDGKGLIDYAQTELTLTVAGLDPARLYELTLFGNRNVSSYGGRTTTLTLEGAQRFINASSVGATVTTTATPDDTTTIGNGSNTANGYVARYDQIVPGTDGAILVRVPAWDGTSDAGRYYLSALRLRTVQPPAPTLARGGSWRYRRGTAEASSPPTAWRQATFGASAWPEGPAPIGYGAPAEGGTVLPDMRDNYTSIFLRRTFEVENPALVASIELALDYDDGFILWLNGREVARVNVAGAPGSFVPHDATATANANATLQLTLSGAQLPDLHTGANVVAAQVFNRSLGDSSDCAFDGELSLLTATGSRTADADQNNLPDDWEQAHLSDLTDPTDRTDQGDPDGDGASNLEEWIAGTDPMVDGSWLMVDVGAQTGQLVVSFETVPASGPGYDGLTRHYALEYRAGLASTSQWQTVPGYENILGAGQTVQHIDTGSDALMYRARVWLE